MSGEEEGAPEEAGALIESYFGPFFARLEGFVQKLVTEGEERGLIGPRETTRIWSRHIVNSAALVPYLPERGTVVDVGSGAGLPGLVIAIMRPDLQVTLVDAMERRCRWLEEVSEELELSNVRVIHARAEELAGTERFDAVTARAVANLAKLIRLTGALIKPGGALLALKGVRAPEEVQAARAELRKYRLDPVVHEVVSPADGESTYVVECRKPA